MERCRLVFSGSGGQGLISAAIILSETAVVYEGLEAVQSQSYGAAARGGATRSDVIISDETIDMPKVFQPNVLLCLTQEAYNKFRSIIRPGGLLITDERFVETTRKVDARQVELPLYEAIMDRIGKPVVFNIGVLGALLALKPLVQTASILKMLEQKFPAAFLAMNKQALEVGYDLGAKLNA
ncbi:MAG: 2-oxoacid:acceptor oxidoreductase family protein [Desulfobacteraceae bacterium]|jgi:2-oxoglutarate ferredoxin oxidoreductase subunit gamma